jgi:hypothetical protein
MKIEYRKTEYRNTEFSKTEGPPGAVNPGGPPVVTQ